MLAIGADVGEDVSGTPGLGVGAAEVVGPATQKDKGRTLSHAPVVDNPFFCDLHQLSA